MLSPCTEINNNAVRYQNGVGILLSRKSSLCPQIRWQLVLTHNHNRLAFVRSTDAAAASECPSNVQRPSDPSATTCNASMQECARGNQQIKRQSDHHVDAETAAEHPIALPVALQVTHEGQRSAGGPQRRLLCGGPRFSPLKGLLKARVAAAALLTAKACSCSDRLQIVNHSATSMQAKV